MGTRAADIEFANWGIVVGAVFVGSEVAHLEGEVSSLFETALLHIGEFVFGIEGGTDVVPDDIIGGHIRGIFLEGGLTAFGIVSPDPVPGFRAAVLEAVGGTFHGD